MGALGVWDFKEHLPSGWAGDPKTSWRGFRWIWEGSYRSLGDLGFQGTPPYGLGLGVPRLPGEAHVDLEGIL